MNNTRMKKEQQYFWDLFDNYLLEKGSPFSLLHEKTGEVTYWAVVNKKQIITNLALDLDFSLQKSFFRINIYIYQNNALFDYLETMKTEIENELGFAPIWSEGVRAKNSTRRIMLILPFVAYDRKDYERLIKKAFPIVSKFKSVFEKYIPNLFDFDFSNFDYEDDIDFEEDDYGDNNFPN